MKLGSQTNSLNNHLYSRMTNGQPEPVVGMGATILMWSDRGAGTIIAVTETSKGRVLTVQNDSSKVVGGSGHDGSAEYEYERNPNGRIKHFRWAGTWTQVMEGAKPGTFKKGSVSNGLRIGEREEYRDPSF